MAPAVSSPSAITRAENIALLYLLHTVPDQTSSNPIPNILVRQKGYTLPFEKERDLVSTLAFLSNVRDDPDRVPAVCIEEVSKPASLNVLLAVNKTTWSDGNQVLKTIKQGLERIFEAVGQVSDKGNADLEAQIFAVIVSVCSQRILSRLRLTANSRKSRRKPIGDVIQDSINALGQTLIKTPKDKTLAPVLTSYVKQAKNLIKAVDRWTKHQTNANLVELVKNVAILSQVERIETLIKAIPNQIMGPTSRWNLLNIVSKVARYHEAARLLRSTAKKFPIARSMRIVIVSLPEKSFQRIPVSQYKAALQPTISRISPQHGKRKDLDRILHFLKVNELKANNQFAQDATKALKESKIHAEIQLLYHCKLNCSRLSPRVFCSSKNACFLCNALFSTEGTRHIPECHGRLYPGWRLPLLPQFNKLEQDFNQVLESRIRNDFTTLLRRKERTIYREPNESSLQILHISASTLSNEEAVTAAAPTQLNRIGPPENDTLVRTSESRSIVPLVTSVLLKDDLRTNDTRDVGANGEASTEVHTEPMVEQGVYTSQMSHAISTTDAPETLHEPVYSLLQGQTQTDDLKAHRRQPIYVAGRLEIHLEYPTERTPVSASSRPITGFDIRWLPPDEAEATLKTAPSSVIDAEQLTGEVTLEIDKSNRLYLAGGESVIQMMYHLDPTEQQGGDG